MVRISLHLATTPLQINSNNPNKQRRSITLSATIQVACRLIFSIRPSTKLKRRNNSHSLSLITTIHLLHSNQSRIRLQILASMRIMQTNRVTICSRIIVIARCLQVHSTNRTMETSSTVEPMPTMQAILSWRPQLIILSWVEAEGFHSHLLTISVVITIISITQEVAEVDSLLVRVGQAGTVTKIPVVVAVEMICSQQERLSKLNVATDWWSTLQQKVSKYL